MENKDKSEGMSERGSFALTAAPKNETLPAQQRRDSYITKIIPKTASRIRSDIGTWQLALRQADNVEKPRRIRLHNLYKDILLDAHLTSQIELRTLPVLATPFVIKNEKGEEDEEATRMLMAASWVTKLNRLVLEANYHGTTVVEFNVTPAGKREVNLIPRTNIVPERGLLLYDQNDDRGVKYREVREYGSWLLEFGEPEEYGLLNKAVPHVLMMRFAQSMWSELCEIYGIPPRYMKTDTTDPAMLDRAEQMMRDMGAGAWFIIDTDEQFDFAKGTDTNGDVYKNLMSVCKEALSILINSAQVGQDTVNGNRSKEESSIELRDEAVAADRERLAGEWNETIIPALVRIGWLPPTARTFEIKQVEDLDMLWKMVCQLLPYKDIPNEWLEDKFGIPTLDKPGGFGMYGIPSDKAGLLGSQPAPQGGRDFFCVSPSLDYEGLHTRLAEVYGPRRPAPSWIDRTLRGEKKPPALKKSTFERAVKHLHERGRFNVSMLKDEPIAALRSETAEVLGKALDDALIETQMPEELTEKLRKDVFVFSGCKTYHELREASQMLLDDNGQIKPMRQFIDEVKVLHPKYNEHYLAAEYEFAVTSGQSAAQWAAIQEDGDDYDLQYRTAGDNDVRPEHAALEGVTLPPSDSFWNMYMPPNGWRCRCVVQQVPKLKYPQSDHDKALQLGERATTDNDTHNRNRAEMFRFNPGLQQVVFPPHHPYYRNVPDEAKK